jgi:hypothetical protein
MLHHHGMAKRRRSRSNQPLPKAAETIGFTETDKAFFAVGDDSGALASSSVAQLYEEKPRPSFWRRLFSKPQDA